MTSAHKDQFPHAPLIERCIDISVSVTSEDFHEKAALWMAEIGESLQLPEQKSVEHWFVKIEKPKNGPPKPKAWLFSVPLIQSKETSARAGVNTESLQFFPPTEQESAKLRYSQCKSKSTAISPFADVSPRFKAILESWERCFGSKKFGAMRMNYWNDLMQFTDAYFHSDGIFFLANALNLFRNSGLGWGMLVPPWSTTLNWSVPQNEGSHSHLEIKTDGSGPIWAICSYTSKQDTINRDASECVGELDIAHATIYEMFRMHFTQEALDFCAHGKVSVSTQPSESS